MQLAFMLADLKKAYDTMPTTGKTHLDNALKSAVGGGLFNGTPDMVNIASILMENRELALPDRLVSVMADPVAQRYVLHKVGMPVQPVEQVRMVTCPECEYIFKST